MCHDNVLNGWGLPSIVRCVTCTDVVYHFDCAAGTKWESHCVQCAGKTVQVMQRHEVEAFRRIKATESQETLEQEAEMEKLAAEFSSCDDESQEEKRKEVLDSFRFNTKPMDLASFKTSYTPPPMVPMQVDSNYNIAPQDASQDGVPDWIFTCSLEELSEERRHMLEHNLAYAAAWSITHEHM
jgi:hypothetical protein